MKILLIALIETRIPSLAKLLVGEIMEPLGLSYLAACARQAGHTVVILDRRVALAKNGYDFAKTDAETLAACGSFDVVGWQLSSAVLEDAHAIIPAVRERAPAARLIAGGPHASLFPENTLESFPELELVVIGEGEQTLVELLRPRPVAQVPGIAYRAPGGIVRTPARPWLTDLDSLPLPARDLLDLDFYLKPDKNVLVDYEASLEADRHPESVRMGELLTSRGCPFSCAFCTVPEVSGRKVRFHGPEYVLADLDDLAARGANYVYFNDDVFTSHRRRTLALCRALETSGLGSAVPWVAQSRAEHVNREILEAMKRAGCVRVEFGFETASPRLLERMRKRGDPETYLRAVRRAHEVGLTVQANMIVGFPAETEEDVRESLEFLRRARPESVLLNVFWPLPGTAIWHDLVSGRYPLPASLSGPEALRIDFPLRMPAHPLLAQHNFTQMPDPMLRDMMLTYLEHAPEALEFYRGNEALFRQVLEQIGGVFAAL